MDPSIWSEGDGLIPALFSRISIGVPLYLSASASIMSWSVTSNWSIVTFE